MDCPQKSYEFLLLFRQSSELQTNHQVRYLRRRIQPRRAPVRDVGRASQSLQRRLAARWCRSVWEQIHHRACKTAHPGEDHQPVSSCGRIMQMQRLSKCAKMCQNVPDSQHTTVTDIKKPKTRVTKRARRAKSEEILITASVTMCCTKYANLCGVAIVYEASGCFSSKLYLSKVGVGHLREIYYGMLI